MLSDGCCGYHCVLFTWCCCDLIMSHHHGKDISLLNTFSPSSSVWGQESDFSAPLSASLIFFLCLLFLFHYLDFLTSPTCRKLFSSAILLKIQGLKVRQHETFRLCSFLSIFFLKGFIQMFSCSPDSLAGQTCRKVSGQWTEMSDKGTLQARTSFIYGLYLTTLSAPPPRFPQTTQCQWG